MQILLSELKIFLNIQLGVICAHMVDFLMPGDICIPVVSFDIVIVYACNRGALCMGTETL